MMKKQDQQLLEQAYTRIYESTEDNYYNDLSLFLAKHYPHPTLKIDKNLVNPDLGYVDDNQKGIFDQDSGKQVGKLQVTISDADRVITLDNIKAFKVPAQVPNRQDDGQDAEVAADQRSYGLGDKVLKHLKEYATNNNLDVQVEIVNPVLKVKFDRIFSDWTTVDAQGDMIRVTRRE